MRRGDVKTACSSIKIEPSDVKIRRSSIKTEPSDIKIERFYIKMEQGDGAITPSDIRRGFMQAIPVPWEIKDAEAVPKPVRGEPPLLC
jgi:hypothetical protein